MLYLDKGLLTCLGGWEGRGGGERTSFSGGDSERFLAGDVKVSSGEPEKAFSLADSNWDSFSLSAFSTSSMNEPPKSRDVWNIKVIYFQQIYHSLLRNSNKEQLPLKA